MKKVSVWVLALLAGVGALGSCDMRSNAGENYLEVIGEAEQTMPDAGYRLNLSYNGPVSLRDKFSAWADSLQREVPGMVLTSDNIYINYMPEQMGQQKITPNMMQSSISYNILAADSAMYGRILRDMLRRNIPFSLNISGTFLDQEQRRKVQQQLMQQALAHAKAKLGFLADGEGKYEIVGVEEMDNTVPYGPEYNDFNRRVVSRLKVKARRL
ncbi:ATP-binding protein [Pontibacter russatus]|uniref:ATP-binding protein n=1 Tax=Pontibacter russatus TaxID=2694929 RepID=UPI00137A707A|nr:ATP-binding protein [Pontibacter russatus]